MDLKALGTAEVGWGTDVSGAVGNDGPDYTENTMANESVHHVQITE